MPVAGFKRRVSVGIAVGRESAVAVVRGGKGATTVSTWLPAAPEGGAAAGVLAAAFADLRDRLSEVIGPAAAHARVHVALMPPLAEVRLLEMPPLKPNEAKIVVARNASRYFLGTGQRVIGVRPRTGSARNVPGRSSTAVRDADDGLAMGAAAPQALVEAVFEAAAATGWQVAAVVPAHAAWLAVAGPGPKKGSQTVAVVAVEGENANVLTTRGAEPVSLRRVPANAGAIADAAGEPGGLALFASSDARPALTRALSALGWIVRSDALASHAAAEAAALSAHKASLDLTPLSVVIERKRHANRTAIRIGIAAAALLIATAGLELWGARRELNAIRAQRGAIAAAVAPLLLLQDSVGRLNARVQAVSDVARESPSYTRALLDIALLLPRDAHLTALHATGDTLMIDAVASRAGAAIEALREAPSLSDVRLRGVIERQLEAGTTTLERFTVVARLADDLSALNGSANTGALSASGATLAAERVGSRATAKSDRAGRENQARATNGEGGA